MTDMTPPPMKRWRVSIDSPQIPKADYEVDAMGNAEACVRAAETALAVAGDEIPKQLRDERLEDQVSNVAGFATAEAI